LITWPTASSLNTGGDGAVYHVGESDLEPALSREFSALAGLAVVGDDLIQDDAGFLAPSGATGDDG